jgi:hypothetical protein
VRSIQHTQARSAAAAAAVRAATTAAKSCWACGQLRGTSVGYTSGAAAVCSTEAVSGCGCCCCEGSTARALCLFPLLPSLCSRRLVAAMSFALSVWCPAEARSCSVLVHRWAWKSPEP